MSYAASPKCPKCGEIAYQTAFCSRVNPILDCELAKQERAHRHHFCGGYGCKHTWVEVEQIAVSQRANRKAS